MRDTLIAQMHEARETTRRPSKNKNTMLNLRGENQGHIHSFK
jgi:hypothetical protein